MPKARKNSDNLQRDLKIFQLWQMERYTQPQIADLMEVSQSTVSRVVRRVLEEYATLNVDDYHAKKAAMWADVFAVVLPQVQKGNLKAIQELDRIDIAMARHIPGGVLPKKVEVDVSTDEETQRALAAIAQIKSRTVVEGDNS